MVSTAICAVNRCRGDGVIEMARGSACAPGAAARLLYALDIATLRRSDVQLDRLCRYRPGVSTPVPTRMDIVGTERHVLVIAGGYEPDQDHSALTTDIIGNSIYIVDAVTGALLWHGSRDGTHKDFNVSGRAMDYSIPARVRVIDFDGNGQADRMYAADMGGQIWRFDVNNGQSASNLINGGVIAQLGGAPRALPPLTDVRRFYYAPDVATVNTKDYNFIHIGIGSGHREHPLSVDNQDRFYALRDYGIGAMTQSQYDSLTVITDASLTPVTDVDTHVPNGSPGFSTNIGGWQGEGAGRRAPSAQVIFAPSCRAWAGPPANRNSVGIACTR
jgi:Tfp pilus tip-associated adhesin PilY1